MLGILFCLFLFVIVFPLWLLSFVLGKIAYKIAGKKGRNIAYFISLGIPFILFLGFVIYNIVEYYYIKNQVKNICKKEAGIFVYVTPEQWREENKDVLDILYPYSKDIDIILKDNDEEKYEEIQREKNKIKRYYDTFNYNGVVYSQFSILNRRIVSYQKIKELNYFTKQYTHLLVDIETNNILVKTIYVTSGIKNDFTSMTRWSDLKIYMNNIPNCYDIVHDSSKIYEEFSNPSLNKGIENDKQNID